MINFKLLISFLHDWCLLLAHTVKDMLKSDATLEIENIALLSQLSFVQQQALNHKTPKPRPTPAFRQFWDIVSKLYPNWGFFLMIVKPASLNRLTPPVYLIGNNFPGATPLPLTWH
jgi:hypothetical protein